MPPPWPAPLWLPLAVSRYVRITGDGGGLAETVRFVEGRPVNRDEDSYFDLPRASGETATLYDHCVRAIRRGLTRGGHGLPLMGTGDWNDGMNLVGARGTGESVWLGFFLCRVLGDFAEVARLEGDGAVAELCGEEAARLRLRLEQHGWDGAWYLRAYGDDGSLLGSAGSPESASTRSRKAGPCSPARGTPCVRETTGQSFMGLWSTRKL